MASNLKLQTALRTSMMDAIVTAIGTSGLLRIYDGTQPTSVATSLGAQVKLAELALSSTAGTTSSGVLTFSTISNDASADATGTASWYSVVKSDGTTRIVEGSVGTSGADLNLNTTSIVAAGPVAVSSFTYTAPGA